MKDSSLMDSSIAFAAKIFKLDRFLTMEKQEFIISKKIIQAATSIGSDINEAQFAARKADSVSSLQTALKNAAETEYWLRLLREAEVIEAAYFNSLRKDCLELQLLLVTTIDSAKKNDK